jgi:hypothetical protein
MLLIMQKKTNQPKETMTKKHFKKIAEIIANNKASNFSNPLRQKIHLIDTLSNYFKTINENFDQDKFSSACLGGEIK